MPVVRITDVGKAGFIADQQSHEIDPSAWSSAQNVRFAEGAAHRILGDTQVFDAPSVTPYFLAPYNVPAARYIIHAGTAAVYADDGTTRTDITGTAPTGGAADRWTGGTLNGVFVLNNGVDSPMYWGGNVASNLATLTGWSANWKCAALRPFKNYLVALDVTKSGTRYPHMVKWSHVADPGAIPTSWDETNPAVDAGEVDLAETSDHVVDCLPLGGVNIVYKERSMYQMSLIGGQYIFQFQRLPGEFGALAAGCIANTPMGHVVLTPGDVILHRGGEPESIITGRLRRWLFSTINSEYYRRSFVVSNPGRNEVWVCFPSDSSSACTQALIWNWRDNVWSRRELQNFTYGCASQTATISTETWASDGDAWSSDATDWGATTLQPSETTLFFASTAPKIVVADSSSTFAGTSFTSTLERTGLTFGAPDVVKSIRSIYPRVDGVTGQTIYVQVGGAMDPEGGYTWSDPVPYVIGSTYKADAFATGRHLGVRFYSTANAAWRIRSYDADVVTRGRF